MDGQRPPAAPWRFPATGYPLHPSVLGDVVSCRRPGWPTSDDLPIDCWASIRRPLHEPVEQQASGRRVAAVEALPGPHRVASRLKRWLLGTRQGVVRHEHLDYYLDEYTFRVFWVAQRGNEHDMEFIDVIES